MSERPSMVCPHCGSVLSAVTFTCVRGELCPSTKPEKVERVVANKVSLGSTEPASVKVSVPRVRFLEDDKAKP